MNGRRIIVLENEIKTLELQKNELLIENAALKATSANSQEREKYQEHLAKKYTDTLQDKEQIICILQEQLGQQAIGRHVNIDRTDGKRLVQNINLTILPTDDDNHKHVMETGEGMLLVTFVGD
ncbi:hypothetical protein SNE40_001922 [Patella caerulea]|uniref:Uncharacterized protein n=1 Tax=Patella caerulea TaxID=87958 RepID=A0AAN8PYF8_PATCE